MRHEQLPLGPGRSSSETNFRVHQSAKRRCWPVALILALMLQAFFVAKAVNPPGFPTVDERRARSDWVRSLPEGAGPVPYSYPRRFRWDAVEEEDPNTGLSVMVDYTTPSRSQELGTCYFFADVGAF